MSEVQFYTGDVFLFEHDDSCISRLICKLSKSPISHAAMYFENGSIIEEGLPHIGTRSVKELGDRAVHVRRYVRYKDSSNALLKVARKHLEDKDPYSMGNLISVGVLLVFNSWKPDAHWAVKQTLNAVCILLAKAIDHKKMPGKHGATCSQLVYEIYKEAGFKLNILQAKDFAANNAPSLITEAISFVESGKVIEESKPELEQAKGASNGFDLDKMCCILLSVMGEDHAVSANTKRDARAKNDDVYGEVIRFASLVQAADGSVRNNLDRGILDWGKEALEHLLKNYSGFVSPGQLYTDCPDLKDEITVIKP